MHEDIQQRRQVVEETKKTKNLGSRYIGHIIENTEKRKREQSLVYEKMTENELKREGKEFADKEKFVTSSYLKMMEENKKWEAEDKKKEEYNKAHTAESQNSVAGLYKTLYDQDVFSGGFRPDLSKDVPVVPQKKPEKAPPIQATVNPDTDNKNTFTDLSTGTISGKAEEPRQTSANPEAALAQPSVVSTRKPSRSRSTSAEKHRTQDHTKAAPIEFV
jgi:hypothetical protein